MFPGRTAAHLRLRHFPVFHAKDRWFWQHGHLTCRHFAPRQRLCLPEESELSLDNINFTGKRTARQENLGGTARMSVDEWSCAIDLAVEWAGKLPSKWPARRSFPSLLPLLPRSWPSLRLMIFNVASFQSD